jgi:hypothetical protein
MEPYGNEYYVIYPKYGSLTYSVNSGASPSALFDDVWLHSGIADNSVWWMHSTGSGMQVVARDTRATALLTNIAWDVSGGSDSSGAKIITNDVANEDQMMFNFTLAYPKIQASNFNSQSGTLSTQSASEGGYDLDNITDGTWAEYNSVFVQGTSAMDIRVAAETTMDGVISVYEGSPTGTLLGSTVVHYTGGAQQYGTDTITFTTTPSGTQSLYLVFSGGESGQHLFNVLGFVCY